MYMQLSCQWRQAQTTNCFHCNVILPTDEFKSRLEELTKDRANDEYETPTKDQSQG